MSKKIKSSSHTKKEELELKKKKQGRHITIFAIALGAAILIGIISALVIQSGVVASRFPAIKIEGKNYKLSDFNYYYYACYRAYLDEHSEFAQYMFDDSQSLKDQPYDDNQSWFEFFLDEAEESMVSIQRTAALAREADFELSKDAQNEIASVMDNMKASADSSGADVDAYLEGIYGKGMTEDAYKKHLTDSHLAAEYSGLIKSEYTFTEEQVSDYYQEHLGKYTFVNYERFYIKASEVDTEPTEEEKKNAFSIAAKIMEKVENGEGLKEASAEFAESGTYYSFDDAYYDASFSYGDWLFNKERKDGDAKIIDDGSGYYVMVFHSRDESSYAAADITDVCFTVDPDNQDSDADNYEDKINELYEDSCTKAENLLAEWKSGEKTLESFETLASEHAAESGVITAYEDLTRDTLDDAVEEWVFDSGRKPGDCSVLYTDSGFHVVYYRASGTEAWKVDASDDMRDDAYGEWYQNLLDTAKVKRHSYVLGFAGSNIEK